MNEDLTFKRRQNQYYLYVFPFKGFFDLELINYWNKRSGLNTAKFYRKIGVPCKQKPLVFIEQVYGEAAVDLIRKLV